LYHYLKTFHIPQKRKLRGILFLILGLSAGIPIVHLMIIGPGDGMIKTPNLIFWELGGIAYVFGAILYIIRFPEKYWPGKFCYFGCSHQIWHCLVLTGVICHYLGSVASYNDRLRYSTCL